MKPKIRGYKEGTMSEDLRSFNSIHKKGDAVRYRLLNKVPDEAGRIFGKRREYHYLDLNNMNLIRSERLLIKERN